MSIRYTLRRLSEEDATTENLKDFELACVKENGRVVIRFGNQVVNLIHAADDGLVTEARAWAISEESPDDEVDTESPTGKTQSSRTWALNAKSKAQEVNTKITEAEGVLENANELLDRLIDITDADEVRY